MRRLCADCPLLSEYGKCEAAGTWRSQVRVCPHTVMRREVVRTYDNKVNVSALSDSKAMRESMNNGN